MKILTKEETANIRKKLLKRLGLKKIPYKRVKGRIIREWLSNFFKKAYEEELLLYSQNTYFPEVKEGKYTDKYVAGIAQIEELLETISKFLERQKVKEIIAFALPEEQYAHFGKNFKEKYNECALKISPKEIKEVAGNILQVYFFPENIDFVITVDHEGIVMINATKEFIEKFKQSFSNWKKFSRLY